MKLILFLLTATSLHSFGSKAQNASDKESVKKVVLAFQEDFNEGSFKNADSYSTKDWVHINPGGGIDKGRDSVLKTVQAVHKTFLKNITMRVESMDIIFLTTDVAIANAIHNIDTYITPDGVRHENERQCKTYVLIKKSGKWLLAQDNNTIIQKS